MRAPERRGPVHVVTVFLVNAGKVLVLRRSDRVSTYRGKWAGVSGYLEADETPRERALKEVREETGLGRSDLSIVREGAPVLIPCTPYIVHPFLFELKRGRVRLDWEHTGSRWVAPSELARLDTVPGLAKVFASLTKEG
jgi:8-oxo-dGTP diphosphatase